MARRKRTTRSPLRPLRIGAVIGALLIAVACWAQEASPPLPSDSGPEANAALEPNAEPDAADEDLAPQASKSDAILIRLPLPIAGNADNQIKSAVQRAMSRLAERDGRPTLVLEFSPGSGERPFGEGSDFTRALGLARFLTSSEVAQVKTIAFIPNTIKGHAVLVAMACDEIVMSPEAELGEAGVDEPQQQSISPVVASGYKEIAERRRTIPVPVVLGMLDRSLEVLRVETDLSTEYVLQRDLDELRASRTIQSQDVIAPVGELARFNGREGRQNGFVKFLAEDRDGLAHLLGLQPGELREDPSLGGQWNAVRVRVNGMIDGKLAESTQLTIDEQVRQHAANLILVEIDSTGGSLDGSITLANYLAGFDPSSIRTVAYVPLRAEGDAILVALACDHLIVDPAAALGGPGPAPLSDQQVELATQATRDILSGLKERNWSAPAAMLDRQLAVYRYRHATTGRVAYFCEAELAEQNNSVDWIQEEQITMAGAALQVDGKRAEELQLADNTAKSLAEISQLYGLAHEPRLVEPGWTDILIRALARPELATLLLVIAGVAMYAELQMPGVGLGGFVASVCFLLFFWSKFLDQTAGWLEVMLFLAGVTFLLLEIFVVPGFGVFGLGGGLLIIVSLVLASQTFNGWPRNPSETVELRNSLLVVGIAGFGIISLGAVMHHYLPRAPFLSRVFLQPPDGEAREELLMRERLADFDHLIGVEGTAVTLLMPSGKARFGDETIDVIADGEVVDRGTRVVVVAVRGTRVLVQAATA